MKAQSAPERTPTEGELELPVELDRPEEAAAVTLEVDMVDLVLAPGPVDVTTVVAGDTTGVLLLLVLVVVEAVEVGLLVGAEVGLLLAAGCVELD